jgi:hypothetical protein
MLPKDAATIYAHFLVSALETRRAVGLTCHGEFVAVTGNGEGPVCFPLWPELESAHYFAKLHWPDLVPTELTLRRLVADWLPGLAEAGIPVGIGLAPYPEAVAVPAERLQRDLRRARRLVGRGPWRIEDDQGLS